MKIEIEEKQVLGLDAKNRAHIKYKLRFWDPSNNTIEGKAIQIYDGDQLIYDTDTDLDGIAELELITDIVNETRKTLNFVIGSQSRTKVFVLELSDPRINSAMEKALSKGRVDNAKIFFPEVNIGIFKDNKGEVLIDRHGNIITSTCYDKIYDIDENQKFKAEKNSKYYLLSTTGAVIAGESFDEIIINKPIPLYYRFIKNGKYGIMKFNGEYLASNIDRSSFLIKVATEHDFPFHQLQDDTEMIQLIRTDGRKLDGWFRRISWDKRSKTINSIMRGPDHRIDYCRITLDGSTAYLRNRGCMCKECSNVGENASICLK